MLRSRPVFEWLKRLGSRSRSQSRPGSRRSPDELLAAIEAALEEADSGRPAIRRLCAALDELAPPGVAMREEILSPLRDRLARWYEQHPLSVQWERDRISPRVVDPLGLTTEETIRSSEAAELAPWATLLRSFVVVTNGANVFHHGCDASDLLALLRHPFAPERIESFPLPGLVEVRSGEVDEIVDLLCTSPRFGELRHLALGWSLPVRVGHLEQLARAPWAASLRTLDLTETMVDWSVDCPAELHRALRALAGFRSLTHLSLYNDLGTTDDVAALLEASLPELTLLSLGSGPTDAAFLELIARNESMPKLEELRLAGGPPRTRPEWDQTAAARFSVFLHGQRVTAEYPKRTP